MKQAEVTKDMVNTMEKIEMHAKDRLGCVVLSALLMVALILPARVAPADDLTEADRILCAAVQATVCVEDGDCAIELPWNLNIPRFVEVDLEGRRLSTTAASGENRVTPIEHLSRSNGTIVFHGFEMGRAFSWVISEATGQVTAAVAAEGVAVSVFGACTPIPAVAPPGSAGEEAKP